MLVLIKITYCNIHATLQ